MLTRTFLVIFLFVAVAAGAYAQEPVKKVYKASIGPDGVQRAKVEGGEYFFEPAHIVVKVNVPVELSVRKVGVVPHSFVIDSADAGMAVKEELLSDTKVIKFTPRKTGKHPFYCDKKPFLYKSHRERGMEGIIEAVE
jgi:plastocyanin domain-containing protein